MKSKRSHEGELLLDHRYSPGLTPEEAKGLPFGAGQGLYEAPTKTCSHCQTVMIINPDRQRERGWCSKCDHYICDNCATILTQTLTCVTMRQKFDELNDRIEKNYGKTINLG